MEDSRDRKRRRDEAEEQESPEAKRLRDDLFLDILDDDAEAGDQDIASVMKSLEEEIALSSPPPPPPTRALVKTDQPDLGFLLEASDDELGLPPPVQSSSDDGGEAPAADDPAAEGVAVEGVVFGQIWGLDDDITGYYDGFDLGIGPDDRVDTTDAAEDGVFYDGGLFDYADVLCAPPDFLDLSWAPTV
ncbi:uncharacterized protein LOC135644678 [Musa acuminata AAA Group]|uniref:(wild Malaysian banana) hypothetical protein n=1 Tax=Musa acuminata subsp. malaccensis TaxID=214687 RepID=A0A804K7F4_MUSAM|nr:PREDICTED: uncharacterized protein LOC103974226 [Musa acuminata subsp. malaccensis]CAG1831970.1 unnamed protein product [Musa acuminata subsp. malaccensis]